jgi:hypothetical protein
MNSIKPIRYQQARLTSLSFRSSPSQQTPLNNQPHSGRGFVFEWIPSECLGCGNPPTLICDACNIEWYCSPECRDQDKLEHDPYCSKLVDDITTVNTSSRLAILLSVDSDTEKLVSLPLNMVTKDGTVEMRPMIDKYIPNYLLRPEDLIIPDGKGGLHLYAEKTDMKDYHNLPKPNNCFTAIMGGKEQFKWRGAIIVTREDGRPETGRGYQDVRRSDLDTVIKYFTDQNFWKRKRYENENPVCKYKGGHYNKNRNRFLARGGAETIKGVVISCLGDIASLGQEQFCQVSLVRENTIYQLKNQSSISVHMGLTVLLKQLNAHEVWAPALDNYYIDPTGKIQSYQQKFPGRSLGENMEQYYLRVETGIQARQNDYGSWGTGIDWHPLIGPVLVVREDMQDITPHQVEALAFFCRYVAHPKIRELKALELTAPWRMLTDNEMTREQKMARAEARERLADEWFSRGKFEEFLREFKKMKIDEGYETWAEVKSPFAARAW